MKALTLISYRGGGHLEFADIPRPSPRPDEILVKVHAAGLNPVDYKIAQGQFTPLIKLALPATMGSDLAGVVVETGSRVRRFKVGDAVFASTFDLHAGSFAEFVAVPEYAAASKPGKLNFVQAASVPMVALTAWQALSERMDIQPGEKVFIPAGAGGIGTIAIQLAKHLGAKVATTTSTGKVDFVRSLGADEVIDYKQQDFAAVLSGYDAVLATTSPGELEKAAGIVRKGGRLVSLNGPPDPAFADARGMNFLLKFVFGLLSRKISGLAKKRGASYAFLFVRADGHQLETIGKLLETSRIRPVIDKVYPFAQAKEALAYLEEGRATGKVVLQMLD